MCFAERTQTLADRLRAEVTEIERSGHPYTTGRIRDLADQVNDLGLAMEARVLAIRSEHCTPEAELDSPPFRPASLDEFEKRGFERVNAPQRTGHPTAEPWLEEKYAINAAIAAQRTTNPTVDPVAAERERCARIVETLAHFMETGAGPLNAPGARLRQASDSIRQGEPWRLWTPEYQTEPEPQYEIPTPSCVHGAQSFVIACDECGALPDGVSIANPCTDYPLRDEDLKAAERQWEASRITPDEMRVVRAVLSGLQLRLKLDQRSETADPQPTMNTKERG